MKILPQEDTKKLMVLQKELMIYRRRTQIIRALPIIQPLDPGYSYSSHYFRRIKAIQICKMENIFYHKVSKFSSRFSDPEPYFRNFLYDFINLSFEKKRIFFLVYPKSPY